MNAWLSFCPNSLDLSQMGKWRPLFPLHRTSQNLRHFFFFWKVGLKAWTIPVAGSKGEWGFNNWLFSLDGHGGQLLGLLLQLLHGNILSFIPTLHCRGPVLQGHRSSICIHLDGGGGGYQWLQGWLSWREAWRWTLAMLGGGRHLEDDRQLDRGRAGGGGGCGGDDGGRSGRSAVAGVDWVEVEVGGGGGIRKLVLDPQCHRRCHLLLLYLA